MTKKEFERKYPQGLNYIIYQFEKALFKIMSTDEIDKVIKNTKGKERRSLIAFRKMYDACVKEWSDASIWMMLTAIDSKELLKDIITLMVIDSKETYDGSEEK